MMECSEMETDAKSLTVGDKYFPVIARGSEALEAILAKLSPVADTLETQNQPDY